MKVISILNYKGGAGKTTTAANLGTALWILGYKVLLIDSDIQGNLTFLMGFDQSCGDPTLHDWMLHDGNPPIYERYHGLYYIPVSGDQEFEQKLDKMYHREDVLRDHLEPINQQFDYVLIDCSFKAGLTNTNALNASDSLIIPSECASFSMQGMEKLMQDYEDIRRRMNPKLEIEGVLLTKYQHNTRFSRQMTAWLECDERYKGRIFKTRIRKCIRFDESPLENKSVFERDVLCNGSEDYLRLAEEITGTTRSEAWPYIALKAWHQEHPEDEGVNGQMEELQKLKTKN